MSSDQAEANGQAAEAGAEAARDAPKLPRVAMLFSASAWTFNVRFGRSGREEGDGVIIMGEVSYRPADGERRIHPARAMVVKSDAKKRLDLVLSPQETVLTIPLEPFAMQRLQERLKELVSHYGMSIRIAFSGVETSERQPLEAVDFAFSSGTRAPPTARPAAAAEPAGK